MSVSPLNFEAVQWAMKTINEKLLEGGSGLLVQAKVNAKNEIIGAEVVTLQTALQNGFEPALFVKGKK